MAKPNLAHSIHVEADGLEPNKVYYYRFKTGHELSPVGKTKTLPAHGANVPQMTFAFASCQQYEHGYYTAYKHMAKEKLDLVFHLGDYIYEYGPNEYVSKQAMSARTTARKSLRCKTIGTAMPNIVLTPI